MRVLLTNLGAAPITVPDPERSRVWPKVVVVDAAGRESRAHRVDLEHNDEYVVTLPEEWLTLDAHAQTWLHDDLMRWVEPLAPGDYTLRVEHPDGDTLAVSEPRALTVVPLDARRAMVVGAHDGPSALATVAVTHRGQGGAVLLETWGTDHHGEPERLASTRVARCPADARAAVSTSMNGLAYPGQWVAWVDVDELHAVWTRDAIIEGAPVTRRVGAAGFEVAEPMLLDLRGNDGSAPGRGVFALWRPEAPSPTVTFGALSAGALQAPLRDLTVEDGPVVDVRGLNVSDGTHAFVLTVQRSDGVAVSWVRGEALSPTNDPLPITRLPGRYLAGDVCLDHDDTVHGVALLLVDEAQGIPRYAMARWSLGATAASAPLVELRFDDPRRRVVSAVAGVGPRGSAAVLALCDDGEWRSVLGGGAVEGFDAGGASVLAVAFLGSRRPFAVLGAPMSGVTWVPLAPPIADAPPTIATLSDLDDEEEEPDDDAPVVEPEEPEPEPDDDDDDEDEA